MCVCSLRIFLFLFSKLWSRLFEDQSFVIMVSVDSYGICRPSLAEGGDLGFIFRGFVVCHPFLLSVHWNLFIWGSRTFAVRPIKTAFCSSPLFAVYFLPLFWDKQLPVRRVFGLLLGLLCDFYISSFFDDFNSLSFFVHLLERQQYWGDSRVLYYYF